MHIFIKSCLLVFVSISMFTACNPDPSHEGDREDAIQDEGITEGMQEFWREQREKFIDGADYQVNEFDQVLEEKETEDSEKVSELQAELDQVRERLSELEQKNEHEWEDTRNEIANSLIFIRRELEDLVADFGA